MTYSAMRPYPIEPIADLLVDKQLAEALLSSSREYLSQLHGRRIWLACSGGRDSLALAALCVQLYSRGQLPFLPQLLHVDHGLQAGSRHWAQHVVQWAQVQQLSCQVLRVQVLGNDEQAARLARYQAMLSYINQNDVLLLGHHADDQAETVLMRLIQGAGVKGLSAMQPWRVQVTGARQNILWRPWLTIRRKTISAYAERLQLPYINDPTNDSGDNVRSSLRHEVLPVLATYNANAIENIARSAQLLTDAQASISAQAAQDMQQTAIEQLCYPPAQRVLNIDKLYTLPSYQQRQLLHYWLTQDEPLPPSKQLVDDVLRLSLREDNDHQTRLYWQARQQSYVVCRYRRQLYRLSHPWLEWLTLPINQHTQTLPSISLSTNITHVTEDIKASDVSITKVMLRNDTNYSWQLQIPLTALASLIASSVECKGELTLKIAPLARKQRLQTLFSTHQQAGKKLYQTLAIPVWLRDSLVVVSALNITAANNKNSAQKTSSADNELPLLLLSPFDSWVLKADESSTDNVPMILNNMITNQLKINH